MSTHTLTAKQQAVIVQALTGGSGYVRRNWYAATPEHHSADAIAQLQAIGYLRAGRFIDKSKGYRYYHVTASGAAALMFGLPRNNRRAA